MKFEKKKALACAVEAAPPQAGGGADVPQTVNSPSKIVNEQSQHDIKLQNWMCAARSSLSGHCWRLFRTRRFWARKGLRAMRIARCAGSSIQSMAPSISLTEFRTPASQSRCSDGQILPRRIPYVTVVGVVYDPFCDELWTGVKGEPARLNGRIIRASEAAKKLEEAIVAPLVFRQDGEKPSTKICPFSMHWFAACERFG